jgi:glycosyltransferase involved in cell wall biosynthesis
MKIVYALRVRDEEKIIRRAIEEHSWTDLIIVCDGGSVDNTCAIASEYPNVLLTHFDEKYSQGKDFWRNPEGKMINYTFSVAEDEGADWVVFEDCDCVPNSHLKRDIRGYIESDLYDCVFVPRLYIYGQDSYFSEMGLVPQIWMWKVKFHLRTVENHRHWAFLPPHDAKILTLIPPYFRMHYFAPDDETTNRKLADIRSEVEKFLHPLDFGGKLRYIPDNWR